MPPFETIRIQLSYSAIAISSSWSTSIPPAPDSCAEVAAPPSPECPRAPVPATTTFRPPSIAVDALARAHVQPSHVVVAEPDDLAREARREHTASLRPQVDAHDAAKPPVADDDRSASQVDRERPGLRDPHRLRLLARGRGVGARADDDAGGAEHEEDDRELPHSPAIHQWTLAGYGDPTIVRIRPSPGRPPARAGAGAPSRRSSRFGPTATPFGEAGARRS